MDKYLASYSFSWSPRIKIKFCPHNVDVSLAPNKDSAYMHLLVLALGLTLLMMKFVRSISIFYGVAPFQLSAEAWRTVLGFEALCDLYAPEACYYEVFNIVYLLRKTTQGAHYFIPQSGVEKIIVNMVNSNHGMRDTMVQMSGHGMPTRKMIVGPSRLSGTWTLALTGEPCPPSMSRRS